MPDTIRLPTRHEPLEAPQPFFSVLAATTPEWFSADITEDHIRGGFAGRFLYLTGDPKPTIDDPPSPDVAKLQQLRRHLYSTANALRARGSVEITLTDGARDWWRTFYKAEMEQNYVGDLAVLFQRVPLYVRKIGMLYAVMEGMEEITSEHLEAGLEMMRLHQSYVQVSSATWGGSLDAKLSKKVMELVVEFGGRTTLRTIHTRLSGRVRANDLKTVIQTLVMFGKLVMEGDKTVCLPELAARKNGRL